MKYRASSGIDLMVAVIAVIAVAISNLMMLGCSLAVRAVNTVWVPLVFEPFKTSVFIWKSFIKVIYREFLHLSIPLIQVFYHKSYLLSRDSCHN